MEGITTLAAVQDKLREESNGTWDALLEPSEMTLLQGRIVSPRLYRYEYPTGLTLTPWATGQLCQFLGMPAAYFKRCPPELQDAQFNHWVSNRRAVTHAIEERVQENAQEEIARANKAGNRRGDASAQSVASGRGVASRWLLRARNEVLRGVLTERYVRLDHLELFAALSPAFCAEYEVDWFALTDESLHLRLHDTRLYRDALPGDRLMAGVHIGNSEVGKRAVTVDALVYRVICTNGLIQKIDGGSLLHQRHISLSRPEFLLSVQQAVKEAFAQSALYLNRLAASVAYPIGDVEKAVQKIALDWGLTQATEEAVKAAILTEHRSQHETLYGLINGVTGAARSLPPDERYALEVNAGRLLESRLTLLTGNTLASTTYPGPPERSRPNSPQPGERIGASQAVEQSGLFALL